MLRRPFALLAVLAVALATGAVTTSCSSTVIVEEACEDGLASCGGDCVDLESDPTNCGDCGVVCNDAECFAGECVGGFVCDPPTTNCDFSCVDTRWDRLHCGGCGVECPSLAECVRSQCVGGPACEPPLEECFGGCVDTRFDPFNCGECGLTCAPDDSCQLSECVGGPGCPDFLTDCFGECVDVDVDPLHCGFCGNDCPSGSLCNGGECSPVCDGVCGTCSLPLSLPSTVPQTTGGSTSGQGDWFASSCAGSPGAELLHSFVAPAAGTYVFSTAGSSFDTVLSLREQASCGELLCNDDFGGGGTQTSRLSTFLEAGQAVYVVVDGKQGASGPYTLTITGSVASACPTLALPGVVPQTITGNTTGATHTFVPSCTGFGAAPEHTFTFTPPVSATYRLDTVGSTYDTTLYVLGASCTGLQLACNDDTFGLQSELFIALTAGQTITIVVDGFGDQSGSYTLNIE
ncbi:MAG: hypothetical protein IPM79_31260 [Polyangiaceae bacterium]|nr:hypothetical protein [Polyangiaceae bacterium]